MPTTVLCVYDLPSSHCNAIVDPVDRKEMFLQVSMSSFIWGCLFISTVWLLFSLLQNMGGLLPLDSMPLAGLLNSSVAELGSLGVIGVDVTCN